MEETTLLAVDVGVRTGLAGFGEEGKLLWWASRNFGSVARLKKAIGPWLHACPALRTVIVEGDGRLAAMWQKQALSAGLDYHWISAETWRQELLIQRERRSGEQAKRSAVQMARAQIRKDGLSPPRRLGHDAAEAILIGLWLSARL